MLWEGAVRHCWAEATQHYRDLLVQEMLLKERANVKHMKDSMLCASCTCHLSGHAEGDGTKVRERERERESPKRRFSRRESPRFAQTTPLLLEIRASGGRRKLQKTADFRAENRRFSRRKPQIFAQKAEDFRTEI